MISFSLCLLFLPLSCSMPLAGWVESPGYPRGYPNEVRLDWRRCAPAGHTLSLSITHLDLEDSHECENDALEIFSDGRPLISPLCGRMSFEVLQSSVNPLLQSSPAGCLSLLFRSDYSNMERHTGFRGFYTLQDVDECDDPDNGCSHICHNYIGGYRCACPPGYFLNSDQHTCNVSCSVDLRGSEQGVVSSPGRPGAYAEDARCSYSLSVAEGQQLHLEFTGGFDVEQGEGGGCVDTLTIKTPTATHGPFCGRIPPPPINTGSRQAQILFSTDGGGTNTGFSLSYKSRAMVCPKVVTPRSSLTPVQPQYHYGNTVTVTCELGSVLASDMTSQDILNDKDFKSMCQKSGVWSPVFECAPVDCGDPELPELVELLDPNPGKLYRDQIQLKCESKYYKLEGDEKYSCEADGVWRSENGQTTWPKCVPGCGLRDNEISSRSRIFGGSQAKLGDIPWQLLVKSPRRGGASLINDRWALTAAHVVDGHETQKLTFYGGMILGSDKKAVTMETEKILIHPGYQKVGQSNPTNFDNDIALIKMMSRVTLGSNIIPVCLPNKTEGAVMEGMMGTISGFGGFQEKIRVHMSRNLLHANVEEYSQDKCQDTPRKGLAFTENMFCAGSNGVDSCKGDSGSPLVIPMLGFGNAQNPYRMSGIVSWGAVMCGHESFKGYYTKVQNYLDWIRETIEKE